VANLSLGSQFGPHDGTGTLDLAMSSLSGPGRIIVAAAGNEGNQSIHAEFTIPASGIVQFPFQVGTYTPLGGSNNDILLLDGGTRFGTRDLHHHPNATTVGPVRTTSPTVVSSNTAAGHGAARAGPRPANGTATSSSTSGTRPGSPGQRNLEHPGPEHLDHHRPRVDFWISYAGLGSGATVRFTDNGQIDNSELVSTPASADSVIAVGAYVTKTSWPCVPRPAAAATTRRRASGPSPPSPAPVPPRRIAETGNLGPRHGIASTLSADATSSLFTSNFARLPGLLRYVSQGTSQASPHIAGVGGPHAAEQPRRGIPGSHPGPHPERPS